MDKYISLGALTYRKYMNIFSNCINNDNKAIRDGKYLARHMPVLGNVHHPIKIEHFEFFVT